VAKVEHDARLLDLRAAHGADAPCVFHDRSRCGTASRGGFGRAHGRWNLRLRIRTHSQNMTLRRARWLRGRPWGSGRSAWRRDASPSGGPNMFSIRWRRL
jgi:hypothetical protein